MVADRRYFALCLHFPNSSLLLFNGFNSSLNRIIVFSVVHNLQFLEAGSYAGADASILQSMLNGLSSDFSFHMYFEIVINIYIAITICY